MAESSESRTIEREREGTEQEEEEEDKREAGGRIRRRETRAG